MYPGRRMGVILAGALLLPARALAQCADGTPPPCRTAAPAPRAATIDDNLIAVFPFRVTGSGAETASLREGAMDLLALSLDEQAGLRVVPSRTLLARSRAFTDASPVSDAAAIARSLGAGTMILGNAVIAGSQLRARAELHDVRSNRSLASVEARGASGDPAPVIDSLAAALARVRLAGGGAQHRSIGEFATTSPAALRLYLAGERASRAGRWQEAADSLMAALRLDSTFALAMYRLRVVSTYNATIAPYDAGALIARAMQSIQRLPRRQAELLQSSYAQLTGNGREAIGRAEGLLTRYPDDPEATYEAAETFFHLGLALGEAPQRALQAFHGTIANDSQRVEAYGHAAELHLATGDTAGALALARRGVAIAPASQIHRATLLALRAIALHEDPAALAREAAAAGQAGDLSRAGYESWRMLSDNAPRALDLAGRFYELLAQRGTAAQRFGASLDLAEVRIAQGRLAEGRAILDAAARGAPGNPRLARARMVAALMDGTDLAATDSMFRALNPAAGLQSASLMGLAAIRLGRREALDAAVARLRAIAQLEPYQEDYVRALEATLEGLGALQRGDTAAALRALPGATGILPYYTSTSIRFADILPWGVLALAKLEASRGLVEQARSRLPFFTFATGIVPARAAADSLRAELDRRPRP